MVYAFIKDGVVIGLSQAETGITDYSTMCGIEENQIIAIGDTVVDGIFYNKNSIASYCMSNLDFTKRFTLEEQIAIEVSTDPIVKVLDKQNQLAKFIDIMDPSTQQGLGYLYNVGLLTYERMNEILTVI